MLLLSSARVRLFPRNWVQDHGSGGMLVLILGTWVAFDRHDFRFFGFLQFSGHVLLSTTRL